MIPYVSFYTCCVRTQWSLGMMFEFHEKDINSRYYHSNFEKTLFVEDDDDSGNISI